jgi:hypothetical protein
MYKTDVYALDPASAALHHFVAITLFATVALVCPALVAIFGRRSWWALPGATIGLPTVIVAVVGGALPGSAWPLTQFILDVMIPLLCWRCRLPPWEACSAQWCVGSLTGASRSDG